VVVCDEVDEDGQFSRVVVMMAIVPWRGLCISFTNSRDLREAGPIHYPAAFWLPWWKLARN
jgi:hypothetical protein